VVIGRATAAIRAGEHVHVHNIESTRLRGDR
jgi:altronate dehydratase small subunit